MEPQDFEWQRAALCRDRPDAWIFFPESKNEPSINFAKSICQKCPVRSPCYQCGLVNNETGIWGGTDDWERSVHRVLLGSSATSMKALQALTTPAVPVSPPVARPVVGVPFRLGGS